MDGDEGHLVAHTSLELADGSMLMASDVSSASRPDLVVGTNVQIHLTAASADEARRVFAALSEGGTVSMPLEKVAWSELFGACVDRYGVHWMVDHTGSVAFPTA